MSTVGGSIWSEIAAMFAGDNVAVLAGVGHLGVSLLQYSRFARYGLQIVAGFDSDERKVGTTVGGRPVYHVSALPQIVRSQAIGIGILATPMDAAQKVAETMAHAGIRGIWNFTPRRLTVPDQVIVERVELAASLAMLSQRLAGRPEEETSRPAEDIIQFNV